MGTQYPQAVDVGGLLAQMNHQFDQMNQRFDQMEARFNGVEQRFAQVNHRMNQGFDHILGRLDRQMAYATNTRILVSNRLMGGIGIRPLVKEASVLIFCPFYALT